MADQKSVDRKALQKMIRFSQREATALRMTFTAYLLNLAAEKSRRARSEVCRIRIKKRRPPDDQTFPQAEQHLPRGTASLDYHSVYTLTGALSAGFFEAK